jgi:hypothetical protein
MANSSAFQLYSVSGHTKVGAPWLTGHAVRVAMLDVARSPALQHDAESEQHARRGHIVDGGQAGTGRAGQQDPPVQRRKRSRADHSLRERRGEQPGRLLAAQRRAGPDGQHLQQGVDRHGRAVERAVMPDGFGQIGDGRPAAQEPPARPRQRAADRRAGHAALDRGLEDAEQQGALAVAVRDVLDEPHQERGGPARDAAQHARH